MSNRKKLGREAQRINDQLNEVASKKYGSLKLVGLGLLLAVLMFVGGSLMNSANNPDAQPAETTTNQ